MTEAKYRELLNNIDKIANDVATLKRTVVLEFKPAADVGAKKAMDNFLNLSEKYPGKWDEITAVDEVRMQREKPR